MILSEKSSQFKQVEPGSYAARCCKLIDLGEQTGEYQGVPTVKHQVLIGWELPTELIDTGDYAGMPATISKFYTASLHEHAALRADLAGWRGRDFKPEELRGFDARTILGKPCLLSVIHTDKGRARVAAVMALPKGTQVPPAVNQPVYLSLEPDAFNQAVFDNLSDGIKKIVMLSPEWKRLQERTTAIQVDDTRENAFDDLEEIIPF